MGEEIKTEKQSAAFKERWKDEEGAKSSLHGRLEASKER